MPRDEALQGFVAVWRVMPQKNAIASGCGAGGMGGVVWYDSLLNRGAVESLKAWPGQKCRIMASASSRLEDDVAMAMTRHKFRPSTPRANITIPSPTPIFPPKSHCLCLSRNK
uniref:HDC12869 n=1 Tax=Drosophila melanogaster TaxID=7227 RepID=Q6IKC9_DROME|nr:TPA_inf: HDC12869 [Drosophila melanogaster]